ncbi:MAG: tRNA epoxyqueuosine(34) reductase QueG [Acidobacteria bacterium]|nr:tRNA epoxyqueuosine(34) reductase QueG [Acidobacteriota bacterium]
MESLSEKVVAKAYEIGFHKVGIVRAAALGPEGERLDQWLYSGFHGEMVWMAREPEMRKDPALLFPAVKSIIAVALNYYTPHRHSDDPATGKISRYAWGDDYHDVLRERLKLLADFIRSLDGSAETKFCVDTAPIMDKAWAVRAGLGWLGKHSNVITREYGSWVFLGELLTSLELDETVERVPDHCGTCTACIDACPTGAITSDYVVDSTKCLSYTTIELRSPEFSDEISDNLNGWIYGCDICQDVCPWNRFEKPTDEPRFEPRPGNVSADLDEVLSLSPSEYAERFRRSAMKRTKLSGLQRNARALKNGRRSQT